MPLNFEIEVNSHKIPAQEGDTILETLRKNGLNVPTLCNMKNFSPTGSCRMCVVEVEGKDDLVPACSHPVEEWMRIKTHSLRVIKARKSVVELLLSNHPDDCLYCIRNGTCELQNFAREMNILERRIQGKKKKHRIDNSCRSIVKDSDKCILCSRCVRVCEELMATSTLEFSYKGRDSYISTAYNKPFNLSSCIHCGQCVLHCPTGALHERNNVSDVLNALHNEELFPVVQYAPSVAISIVEAFQIKPGRDHGSIINSALRKMGFKKVYDASFGTDVLIIEEAKSLLEKIDKPDELPLISSSCPSWVKFVEQFYPELISNLSVNRSPQQINGAIIKTVIANELDLPKDKIVSISVMPCMARKSEAARESLTHENTSDVDIVLTAREFIQLLKISGLDLTSIESGSTDKPMNTGSSAARLYSVPGGFTEGMLRTFHFNKFDKEMSDYKISPLRKSKGCQIHKIKVGRKELNVAIINGLAEGIELLEEIKNGRNDIHYLEVMACPGGCAGGGGQLRFDDSMLRTRQKAIYAWDDVATLKVAHKNPSVLDMFEKMNSLSKEDKEGILYTKFFPRTDLLL